ncbi:Bax inhibitor-1 family protein [Aquaspirillum serpens]|uniref:Bax inhibitor-1 family protein n=1 Tax=Aquaspirillum serpens TaxID=190 RepID=UPI0003B37245|nr:Bax inhibitor-1 family protein [Aquaspirillum serpens]
MYPTSSTSYPLSASQNRVLRNTYLLLAISLIPTMAGAMFGVNLNFSFMKSSPIVSTIAMLAVIYGLMFAVERNRNSSLGVGLLLAFTFVMGVLLGPILQLALGMANGGQLIAVAAGGTAAVFFVMAAIATTVKKQLNFLGNFLSIGAVVLMVAVVANLFLQIPALHLTLCAAFVLFSSMLILFQVSEIVHGGETNYVSATLTLFVAVYNLFTSLLQLLMAFTGMSRD